MKNKIKVHLVKPIRNDRRRFLKLSVAALVGSGLIFMTGCSDDDDVPAPDPGKFDLGSSDLGVLNNAYALEQVRRMRGEKGWIIKSENTLPPDFSAIYGGATPESNTTQGGVNLSGMFGSNGGDNAVTASFDEPLTMEEVLAIARIFIV